MANSALLVANPHMWGVGQAFERQVDVLGRQLSRGATDAQGWERERQGLLTDLRMAEQVRLRLQLPCRGFPRPCQLGSATAARPENPCLVWQSVWQADRQQLAIGSVRCCGSVPHEAGAQIVAGPCTAVQGLCTAAPSADRTEA